MDGGEVLAGFRRDAAMAVWHHDHKQESSSSQQHLQVHLNMLLFAVPIGLRTFWGGPCRNSLAV